MLCLKTFLDKSDGRWPSNCSLPYPNGGCSWTKCLVSKVFPEKVIDLLTTKKKPTNCSHPHSPVLDQDSWLLLGKMLYLKTPLSIRPHSVLLYFVPHSQAGLSTLYPNHPINICGISPKYEAFDSNTTDFGQIPQISTDLHWRIRRGRFLKCFQPV